jgi:Holliday junction resolvase RusA-like endonuclease
MEITFTVPAVPVAKPRMTQSDRWEKRPAVLRYWAYCDKVKWAAYNAGYQDQCHSITGIRLVAYLPLPPSWNSARRALHIGKPHFSRPDLDNLLKSIPDALTNDDSSVWQLTAQKLYDDGRGPRAEVTLTLAQKA